MISLKAQMTLAATILKHIHKFNLEEGPISRSALNYELRKLVDNEMLSTILLNLLGYGYLHKKLEETTVMFWVTAKVDPTFVTDFVPDLLRPRDTGPDLIAAAAEDGVEPQTVTEETPCSNAFAGMACPLDAVVGKAYRISTVTRANAIYEFLRRRPAWPMDEVKAQHDQKIRPLLVERALAYLQDRQLVRVVDKAGTVFFETATCSALIEPYVPKALPVANAPVTEEQTEFDLVAFNNLSPKARKLVTDFVSLLGSLQNETL